MFFLCVSNHMVAFVCYPRANYTRTNTNSIFDGLLCPEFLPGAVVHCRIFSRGSLGVYDDVHARHSGDGAIPENLPEDPFQAVPQDGVPHPLGGRDPQPVPAGVIRQIIQDKK